MIKMRVSTVRNCGIAAIPLAVAVYAALPLHPTELLRIQPGADTYFTIVDVDGSQRILPGNIQSQTDVTGYIFFWHLEHPCETRLFWAERQLESVWFDVEILNASMSSDPTAWWSKLRDVLDSHNHSYPSWYDPNAAATHLRYRWPATFEYGRQDRGVHGTRSVTRWFIPGVLGNLVTIAGLCWIALFICLVAINVLSRWTRLRRGACTWCGYDLRGSITVQPRCSECGRVAEVLRRGSHVGTLVRPGDSLWRTVINVILAFCGFAIAIVAGVHLRSFSIAALLIGLGGAVLYLLINWRRS